LLLESDIQSRPLLKGLEFDCETLERHASMNTDVHNGKGRYDAVEFAALTMEAQLVARTARQPNFELTTTEDHDAP
jgi:hypothetical protein